MREKLTNKTFPTHRHLFVMRFKAFAFLISLALLTGCANQGTVVEKRARPNPFTYSAGIDAVFSFLLRDQQGNVHSQMVTEEVFQRYELGDYFNDQQPPPAQRSGFSKDVSGEDSKTVKPVVHHRHASVAKRAHHVAHHAKKRQLRAVVKQRDDETAKPRPDVTLQSTTPVDSGLNVTP